MTDERERLILQVPEGNALEALEGAFEMRETGSETSRLVFHDTWEWSLWFRRMLLYVAEDGVHLAEGGSHWPGTTQVIADEQRPFPRFAKDFADSLMRKALRKITGLRALRVVASLRTIRRSIDLLDDNRKIVCRLDLTEISTEEEGDPFFRLAAFRPLRGYDAEADAARDLLEEGGATPVTKGPLAVLFEREGRSPQPYTLKPVFEIQQDTRAREAVRKIVHRMLKIAVSNEHGVIDDIDTEFLHDYRICVRKIRSLLSLVKGVYPPERTESLKRTFSALGGATNRLRDLDVYLLSRDDYTSLLPEALRPGLEPLFRDFTGERTLELAKVRSHLVSPGYRREVEALERFFTEPDALPVSPASHHTIGPLVARRIQKRYRAIRRLRKKLTPATPDPVVHRLRIECKKLRYLLEFFSELFQEDEAAQVQKQLRRLQNRLGCFNDYSVQQRALLEYWERKRRQKDAEASLEALALALGGLVAVLHHEQQAERERIHAALDAFCATDVKGLVERVFRVDPEERPGHYVVH